MINFTLQFTINKIIFYSYANVITVDLLYISIRVKHFFFDNKL